MWFNLRSSSSSSSSHKSIDENAAAKERPTMSSKKSTSSPPRKLNVDEEYNNALRTKSFIDIWKKAHQHLKKTTSTAVIPTTSPVDESEYNSSYSLRYYSHLPDSLLDPAQETLVAATSNSATNSTGHRHHLRRLLIEYFDTTLETCIAFTSLLACIDSTRTQHLVLHRLLVKLCATRSHQSTVSDKLTTHLNLENPFSHTNLSQFQHTHSLYNSLIRRLAAARRRIKRRKMLIRASKYGGAALCSMAAVAALVVAVHSIVGIALIPTAALFGPRCMKRRVTVCGSAQVDAALKGAYIVGRDLDTISRMVRRLHYEVEHEREVARMALMNSGERKLVREMVREMESEEVGFEEQLMELEEHVYLCLLTINRSRRLLVEEMGGAAPTSVPATA